MQEKTLFEIPIYAMSENEFNKRWNEKREKLYADFVKHGHTDESAKQGVSSCFYPRWLWEYNQIIGYIKVSVTATDVIFDVFCSMDKKYYIDSKQKHFIEDWHCNGTHFYAIDKSEAFIKQEIRTWLKCIEKEHLRGRFYVDYSTFNNIFDLIEINAAMRTL
ncbi:MAG: hypothetical protein ACLVML_11725 [Candidatus Gastranaerophilaceae bacterium]|jgi:hypothetical protein|nr:hypothetical protein [Christensenellales bacterium]